jgi:pimeloyl-ACP methyl ester carboxylesterase
MTTFILVHGALHGGWCWYKVQALLEARGRRVLCPDLPGHGRNRGAASLATHRGYVDFLAGLLREQPEPVVLVGHSMGGTVITAAAEAVPEKVARLVYLAAFLAPSGTSLLDWSGRAAEAQAPGGAPSLEQLPLEALFYGDCPPEDVALARLCLTPQESEPLTAPVVWTPERCGRIPRGYIGCSQDRAIDVALQRASAAAAGAAYVELDSSHSPFFSMPQALVDALEALAA